MKGELNAIIDKAREYGVPVLMVDPRNTLKICLIHRAVIEYGEDRIGICSKGGEKWHREVAALIDIYFKALKALYEDNAQKGLGVLSIDGSPVPLGLTALLRSLLGHIAREVEWRGAPDATGLKTLWIERQSNPKQKNINDNQ